MYIRFPEKTQKEVQIMVNLTTLLEETRAYKKIFAEGKLENTHQQLDRLENIYMNGLLHESLYYELKSPLENDAKELKAKLELLWK